MSEKAYPANGISTDILKRASVLHAVAFPHPHEVCNEAHPHNSLDKVFDWASRKLYRVKVTMTVYQGHPIQGRDNAMAWFDADHGVFAGVPVLSSLLTTDGADTPTSMPVGWLQIHRYRAIWFGWPGFPESPGLSESYTDWSGVTCYGGHLQGNDQNNHGYDIHFELSYAGVALPWPDWLLDGAPADPNPQLGVPVHIPV